MLVENWDRISSMVAVFVTSAPCIQCFCHVYMLYVLLEHLNMMAQLAVSPGAPCEVKCNSPCTIFLVVGFFFLLSLMTAFDNTSGFNSSPEVRLNGSDVFPIMHRAVLCELYFINPKGLPISLVLPNCIQLSGFSKIDRA